MSASEFIAYVGPPEIHDSTVVSVTEEGGAVRVELRTVDDHPLTLIFHGASSVRTHQPAGMFVYALVELASPAKHLRRFVLANSDDDESSASFALLAESFTASHLPDATHRPN